MSYRFPFRGVRGARVLLWSAVVVACGGEPGPGAGSGDVTTTGEDVNLSGADSSSEDSSEDTEDTVSGSPVVGPEINPAGTCGGVPADLYGAVVWSSNEGVHLAPHVSVSVSDARQLLAFDRPTTAHPPTVLLSAGSPGPAFLVAADDDLGATLHIFDREGNTRGAILIDNARSAAPHGSGRVVAWPVVDRTSGAGRIAWVDVIARRELFSLETSGALLTPAAAFGTDLASGGGSHWLVGTSTGLSAYRDTLVGQRLDNGVPNLDVIEPPALVGQWLETAGTVAQVLVVGDHVVVGLATGDDGLVDKLRILRLEGVGPQQFAFTSVGEPIAMPGPVTAHPVAWNCKGIATRSGPGCARDADAAVVAAGDGWLGVWRLPSGDAAFLSQDDIHWTSLSLGRGGWISGGGSHWLPADDDVSWTVMAMDTTRGTSVELLGGPGHACIGAPLWDTDGTLSVVVPESGGSIVSRFSSGGGAVAEGWARPLGDGRNSGRPVGSSMACADGVERGQETYPTDGEDFLGAAHMSSMDLVFGRRANQGFFRWLGGAGGDIRVDVADASSIPFAVPVSRTEAVVIREPLDPSKPISLRRYEGVSSQVFDHALLEKPGTIVGLVSPGQGTWLVGDRHNDRDVVHRVFESGGWDQARDFGTDPAEVGLVKLLPGAANDGPFIGGDGAVMVLNPPGRVVLRRIDGALETLALGSWSGMAEPVVVDAIADFVGAVRVLVEDGSGGGEPPRLLDFSYSLELQRVIVLPSAGSIGLDGMRNTMVVGPDGIFRVGGEGAVGLMRRLDADLVHIPRSVAHIGDGFSGFFVRDGAMGRSLVRIRFDFIGFGSCGQAGVCVNVNAYDCDSSEVCVARGCEPVTGTCHTEAFAGCEP